MTPVSVSRRPSAEDQLTITHEDADLISPIPEERQSFLESPSTHARSPVDSGLAAKDTQLIQSHPLEDKPDSKQAKNTAPLSYRKRSLFLLIIYLPIIIVPWVIQQVLAVRPLNAPSYYNQRGDYGGRAYLAGLWWPVMVRLLNVIGALITVPIVGALLSQAAVIYSQRRHLGQQLNLRQTLALADKSWGDVLAVWAAIKGNGTASKFLWYATGLLIISAIQIPLQQILVSNKLILIMTCGDHPVFPCGRSSSFTVAHDPEPDFLANIRQNSVVKQTMDKLATTFVLDEQPHLWRDPQGASGGVMQNDGWSTSTFFYWFQGIADADESFFISHVLNNTQTGILREHAMRLNSTTECSRIARDQFPATCEGTMPLIRTLDDPKNITIRICAPGNYGKSPWAPSRDRQDITEELYVDVWFPDNTTIIPKYAGGIDYWLSNFTTLCTTTTTRGYFELPNYRNDYLAQPLTNKWPDDETMWSEWNDYIMNGGLTVPSTIDIYPNADIMANPQGPDPFGTWALLTPGPLMTVALALFGNGSFFHSANEAITNNDMSIMNQTCQDANFPFQRIDGYSSTIFRNSFMRACAYVANRESQYSSIQSAGDVEVMYYNWLTLFNNTDLPSIGDKRGGLFASPSSNAAAALDIGVYLATEAWLTDTASGSVPFGPRNIYYSPGSLIVRPKSSLAATIIISALIAVQVGGLVALIWYIYSIPAWTPQLNALAVAQMAQSIPDGDLPPMGPISDAEMRKLEKLDGLVGVANDDWGKEGGLAAKAENVQLARGASGIVRRSMRPKKRKDKSNMQRITRRTLGSRTIV